MQVKAVSFYTPPIALDNPGLNIWQALYYELYAAGYSKEQIAKWTHLSERSVNRLLAGNASPSFKVLSRMLHAYCCHSLTIGG
jgi:transcriptional regulator with XRE-family HTH domain